MCVKKVVWMIWVVNLVFGLLVVSVNAQQVSVTIDADAGNKLISPYIYGKNNSTSSNPDKPTSEERWTQIKESGVTILRENSGNECTKYNWERKLVSKPDWYNEVALQDWDYEAQTIQNRLPGIQAMFGFQLLGWVAKSKAHNWDAWSWYVANGNKWLNAHQNLAGGGTPDPSDDGTALVDGDPNLYLEEWPIEKSIAILDHWFADGGLGLNPEKLHYWSMDNEPDIWSSTHDDVMKTQLTADEFMNRFFEAAKLARSKFPDIKIVGPATANEWFWYNWPGNTTTIDGKKFCWLEYFIKRVADEEKATGIKLLDVLAIHFYPGSTKTDELVQMHRIYFDDTYVFPEANGVFAVNGGWDTSLKKEFIFKRCNQWLDKYMGTGHGVKMGVTETGIKAPDANTAAVWYASTLGEFMRNDVELFTPWSWKVGMWEVLHLFARYNKPMLVSAVSSQENLVSAYATKNAAKDSLVVTLVNRSSSVNKEVNIGITNFNLSDEAFDVLSLNGLPTDETFVSHTQNALKKSTISKTNNGLLLTLPPLSVTSVLLKSDVGTSVEEPGDKNPQVSIGPNPSKDGTVALFFNEAGHSDVRVRVFTQAGSLVFDQMVERRPRTNLPLRLRSGLYIVEIAGGGINEKLKVIVQ
jgi:hypothetical protein